MNITIFYRCESSSDLGGTREVIRNLSREFIAKGHLVSIVVFTACREYLSDGFIKGVNIYRLYAPFSIVPRQNFQGFIDILKLALTMPYVLVRLLNILRKNNCQTINVHFIGINAFYAWVVSYIANIPYVITMHAFSMAVLPFLKAGYKYVIRIIVKAVLRRAAFVTSCSKYLLDATIEQLGIINNKSRVILNGIDPVEFRQNGQRIVKQSYILSMGRLAIPSKGFDIALFAFKDIIDSGFDINLVIAGDGPDRKYLEDIAKLTGIENRVLFFGPADRAQAVNLIKHCEFLVTPSRLEPLGIVNLEAMAAGKAIVAARTGGIPEVVEDRVTGLLVEPCSDKVLFLGMKQLLEDKDLRDRLGNNGRKKVENNDFSWQIVADKYLKVFNDVLAG